MTKLIVFILLMLHCNVIFSQKEFTHDVYFDSDKFIVPNTEENRLLLFISTLTDINIDSISIYGFCDDVGASTYNLKLSKQRANAIKTIFSNNQINDHLITSVDGKGEVLLKIINEKNVLKIRGLNRKVEIIVKEKTTQPIIQKPKEIVQVPLKEKTIIERIKAKDLKVGDKIIFDTILFKTGYSEVASESIKTLTEIAESLMARDDIYFTIQGHVCCTQYSRDAVDRKTKKRNLSEARAKYIYEYLAKKGLNKKRMRYLGMRRKFPLGGDPKLDRRVEIVITYVVK